MGIPIVPRQSNQLDVIVRLFADFSPLVVELARGHCMQPGAEIRSCLWQGAQVLQHLLWQSSPQRAIAELGFKRNPLLHEVVWPQVAASGRLDARLISKLNDRHPLRIYPRRAVQ